VVFLTFYEVIILTTEGKGIRIPVTVLIFLGFTIAYRREKTWLKKISPNLPMRILNRK
jgi:hypothetical protein